MVRRGRIGVEEQPQCFVVVSAARYLSSIEYVMRFFSVVMMGFALRDLNAMTGRIVML